MSRCTFLVGLIEIDATAGASFGLVSCRSNRFSPEFWQDDFADDVVYSAVLADLARLGDELDIDFRRLQSRLAA
jgi:hypothetical protein